MFKTNGVIVNETLVFQKKYLVCKNIASFVEKKNGVAFAIQKLITRFRQRIMTAIGLVRTVRLDASSVYDLVKLTTP